MVSTINTLARKKLPLEVTDHQIKIITWLQDKEIFRLWEPPDSDPEVLGDPHNPEQVMSQNAGSQPDTTFAQRRLQAAALYPCGSQLCRPILQDINFVLGAYGQDTKCSNCQTFLEDYSDAIDQGWNILCCGQKQTNTPFLDIPPKKCNVLCSKCTLDTQCIIFEATRQIGDDTHSLSDPDECNHCGGTFTSHKTFCAYQGPKPKNQEDAFALMMKQIMQATISHTQENNRKDRTKKDRKKRAIEQKIAPKRVVFRLQYANVDKSFSCPFQVLLKQVGLSRTGFPDARQPDVSIYSETALNSRYPKADARTFGDKITWVAQTNFSHKHGVCILSRCKGNKDSHKICGQFQQYFLWSVMVHQNVPIHIIGVYCPPTDDHVAAQVAIRLTQAIERIQTAKHLMIIAGDFNAIMMPTMQIIAKKAGLKELLLPDEVTRWPRGEQAHRPSKLDSLFHNFDVATHNIHRNSNLTDHGIISATFTQKAATQFPIDVDKSQWLDFNVPIPRSMNATQSKKIAICEETRKRYLTDPLTMFEGNAAYVRDQFFGDGQSYQVDKRWSRFANIEEHLYLINDEGRNYASYQARLARVRSKLENLYQERDSNPNMKQKEISNLLKSLTSVQRAGGVVRQILDDDGQAVVEKAQQDKMVVDFWSKIFVSAFTIVSQKQHAIAHLPTGVALNDPENAISFLPKAMQFPLEPSQTYKNLSIDEMKGLSCGNPFEAITKDAILNVVKSQPNGKSMGNDLFNSLAVKPITEHSKRDDVGAFSQQNELTQVYVDTIYDYIRKGQIPDVCMESKFCLLSKKESSAVQLSDTRPIQVSSHHTKIFEGVILWLFEQSSTKILHTDSYQCAFKEERMTAENIAVINMHMLDGNIGKNDQKKVFISSDISKAYDSIIPEILFQMLDAKAKTKEDYLAIYLLKLLYSTRKLKFGNSELHPTRGVQQGGVTSCKLFNFYLDQCLKQIPSLNKKIEEGKLLAFADDLLTICDDIEDSKVVLKDLQSLSIFGLEMNKKKTKIVSNRPELRSCNANRLKEIEGVDVVDRHRYLGWQMTCSKATNKKLAREYIMKVVKYVNRAWKFSNANITRDAHQWFVRSLFQFMLPPLMAADVVSRAEFEQWESQAYRTAHWTCPSISNETIRKFQSRGKASLYMICCSIAKRLRERMPKQQRPFSKGRISDEELDWRHSIVQSAKARDSQAYHDNFSNKKKGLPRVQLKDAHIAISENDIRSQDTQREITRILKDEQASDLLQSLSASRPQLMTGSNIQVFCKLHKEWFVGSHTLNCSALNVPGKGERIDYYVTQIKAASRPVGFNALQWIKKAYDHAAFFVQRIKNLKDAGMIGVRKYTTRWADHKEWAKNSRAELVKKIEANPALQKQISDLHPDLVLSEETKKDFANNLALRTTKLDAKLKVSSGSDVLMKEEVGPAIATATNLSQNKVMEQGKPKEGVDVVMNEANDMSPTIPDLTKTISESKNSASLNSLSKASKKKF